MKTAALKKTVSTSPFIPSLCILIALLFLRDLVGLPVPSVLFLGLTVIVAVLAEKTDVIAFCFCCIPMLNAFQTKYALWLCILIYALRFKPKKFAIAPMVPILFLMIWEVVHGFTGTTSLVQVLRLFTELSFCCFVMALATEDLDFNRIIRAMSAVAVCVCVIILLSQLKQYHYQVSTLFSGTFRLGFGVDETRMSVGFNPNYLSYMCLCCIEGLACIVYKHQQRTADFVCITVLGVFGLLTMSKKFILCTVAFLFLFAFCRKKKIRTLLGIAVLLVAVWLIFKQGFPSAYEALIARFEYGDLTTGRADIFAYFHEQLSQDTGLLLFGVGLQDYRYKLLTRYMSSIPHNGFQELLVMWGIPGLIAFVLFLWLMVRRAKRLNPHIRFINYVPFLIMLLNVQVTQMASSSLVCVLIAVVYLCMVSDLRPQKKEIHKNAAAAGAQYVGE